VVAGDRGDLAGVLHVWPVELVPVELFLVRPVDDVAQVKEKRRVVRARLGCVVGRHPESHALLVLVVGLGPSGVADRVEPEGSGCFDLLNPFGADQIPQLDHRVAAGRRDRAGFLGDPARHPRP
jgi:hypothetical protein